MNATAWPVSGPVLALEELHRRNTDVLDIELAWRRSDRALFLILTNRLTGDVDQLDVPPGQGMEMFEHPCSYSERASSWVKDAEAHVEAAA